MICYIDLTEFLLRPHRTGIQRVTGEVCTHWPADVELIPVRAGEDGRFVKLPERALAFVREFFATPRSEVSAAVHRIQSMTSAARHSALHLDELSVLFCPEVFWDDFRVRAYESMLSRFAERCAFLVYDLLPLTHPEHFVPDAPHGEMGRYYRLIKAAPNVGFISNYTRAVYCSRLLRSNSLKGQVFRLGSDGLGARPESGAHCAPNFRFSVVGTIEPRKRHDVVLDAFDELLKERTDVELTFAGRMGWVDGRFSRRLREFEANHSNFTLCLDPEDATIAETVRASRATIFMSAVEGFGLPPVESLWLGTPVIASYGIPSLEAVGETGVVLLDPTDQARQLRSTAMLFLDNMFYENKRKEAAGLILPDWKSFASDIAVWLHSLI